MGALHTPGPHRVEAVEHLGDPAYAVRAADGDLIAVGCVRGDAVLFAAAPELLEALNRLLDECAPESDSSTYMKARELAEAAVAKALGQ